MYKRESTEYDTDYIEKCNVGLGTTSIFGTVRRPPTKAE